MPLALFGIEDGSINLAVNLLILVLVVVWLSLVYWTWADARRRIADPVLIATARAVPVVFLAMDRWLHGFAYHVDLSAWTFVQAASAAVAIAWLTVSWQSYAVARANPGAALKYE